MDPIHCNVVSTWKTGSTISFIVYYFSYDFLWTVNEDNLFLHTGKFESIRRTNTLLGTIALPSVLLHFSIRQLNMVYRTHPRLSRLFGTFSIINKPSNVAISTFASPLRRFRTSDLNKPPLSRASSSHFSSLCCLNELDLTQPAAPHWGGRSWIFEQKFAHCTMNCFPPSLGATYMQVLMHEVERVYTCTHTHGHVYFLLYHYYCTVSTGTHTSHSYTHIRHTHTVIWWLLMLMSCCGVYPTRMVGVAWGQPPPAFNDVYLAHVWGVNGGMLCVYVCVTDWQMFKMREGTHQADSSRR